MPFTGEYTATAPTRAELDAGAGVVVLEFGTGWCGHCMAAQPALQAALAPRTATHLKVEDGKGRPLGRSFAVKLWPTVIVLRDGQEVARVVRPRHADALAPIIAALDDPA